MLHLQVTDPNAPFQPISVGGTNLPGNHLISQNPQDSVHATQQAAASLADLAVSYCMSAKVTDIMFGSMINNDGDFWDMMKPILQGAYLGKIG